MGFAALNPSCASPRQKNAGHEARRQFCRQSRRHLPEGNLLRRSLATWEDARVFPDSFSNMSGCARRCNAKPRMTAMLKHDPEKWMPAFGKDHARTMS